MTRTTRRVASSGFAIVALQLFALAAAAQTPDTAMQDIKWYVHDSLIDASHPLSFYQALIEQATEDAGTILMGYSGPFDQPCCADFSAVSVSSFSDTGGNTWNTVDSAQEFDNLDLIDPTGVRAFVVDMITFCGGTGMPIG